MEQKENWAKEEKRLRDIVKRGKWETLKFY